MQKHVRLNLRDLFWMTLVAAVALGWWQERTRLTGQISNLVSHPQYQELSRLITHIELELSRAPANSPRSRQLRAAVGSLKKDLATHAEEFKAGIRPATLSLSGPQEARVGDTVEFNLALDIETRQPFNAVVKAVHGIGLEPVEMDSNYVPQYALFKWNLRGLSKGQPVTRQIKYKCVRATSNGGVSCSVEASNGISMRRRLPITITE